MTDYLRLVLNREVAHFTHSWNHPDVFFSFEQISNIQSVTEQKLEEEFMFTQHILFNFQSQEKGGVAGSIPSNCLYAFLELKRHWPTYVPKCPPN